MVVLAQDEQFVTTGSNAYVARLVGPTLKGIGPKTVDITIHALGNNFSTNFKYKVTAEKSYDGDLWVAFAAAVLSEQTATGYVLSSPYATRADFGMQIRFSVATSDTGSKEVGVLSLSAAFRLYT